jgi:molecular chaperone DnaK
MAADNRLLARFGLEGNAPAPRGLPRIEVTFDTDANGILSVSAKDKSTGKEQAVTVTASSGLTEADIQKMVKEAQAHEAEDKVRRQRVEARNRLEVLALSVARHLDENRARIPEPARGELEAALAAAKEAIAARRETDAAELWRLYARLEQASHRAAEMACQAASAPAGAEAGAGAPAGDGGAGDEVVDAEYEAPPPRH